MEAVSWNEMIITPDIYFNNPRMNIGVQYDPRHSVFPNLDHHPWMASPTPTQVVKEEPRDDAEYGQEGRMPLTPPPFQGYATPPEDRRPSGTPPHHGAPPSTPPAPTPPLSTPSPQKQEGSSNSEGEYYESGDSLKRLQLALHRTGMITEEKLQCPVCEFSCSVRSQFNEHLLSHETKCSMCDFNGETSEKLREHMRNVHDCDDDSSWGDDELNTPKVNSQGKVKTFRCKQCEFSAVTKLEFWEHSRTHIKQERLLTCPKCPFVTEYKHHLEYHLRNHFGSKPFKCDKCSYSCVNKSMLNSHLKSHSNIYQFRCADCTYATKYCHSLKLHLRKYGHNPAMVLNPDGSPNPLPIVDVYGTRRGPKQKPKQEQHLQQPQVPNIFNPYSLLPTQMPYYNILNGFGGFPFPQDVNMEEKNNNVEKEEVREEKAPLDLSCPEPMVEDSNQEVPVKNRRKGKAFKLDRIALRLQQQIEVDEHEQQAAAVIQQPTPVVQQPPTPVVQQPPTPVIQQPPTPVVQQPPTPVVQQPPTPVVQQPPTPVIQQATPPPAVQEPAKSPEVKPCEADSEQKSENGEKKVRYNCTYCDISFKDIIMYTMHMGYHGYEDPFKCNMCGQQSTDKVAFFLHIARISHS